MFPTKNSVFGRSSSPPQHSSLKSANLIFIVVLPFRAKWGHSRELFRANRPSKVQNLFAATEGCLATPHTLPHLHMDAWRHHRAKGTVQGWNSIGPVPVHRQPTHYGAELKLHRALEKGIQEDWLETSLVRGSWWVGGSPIFFVFVLFFRFSIIFCRFSLLFVRFLFHFPLFFFFSRFSSFCFVFLRFSSLFLVFSSFFLPED